MVKEDGSQHAVDLYKPGPDAYLRDYTAGGTGGSNFRFKRVTHPIGYPSQLGYNQVPLHIIVQTPGRPTGLPLGCTPGPQSSLSISWGPGLSAHNCLSLHCCV